MRFLLRMAFWLCVVLVFLPMFAPGKEPPANTEATAISAVDAVSAASATVSDVRKFCERQPDACAVGAQAFVAIGHKAQAGARILLDFIKERGAPQSTGSVAPASRQGTEAAAGTPSRNTLTADDLVPAWHGPQPRNQMASRGGPA
jgi:hypothetical protein